MTYQQEVFDLMGILAKRFNERNPMPQENKYCDSIKSQNFRADYTQIGSNSCQLIKGENYHVDCGSASVTPDMRFGLSIFPNWDPLAKPLRLEVDNQHRAPVNKLIHVNAAGGAAVIIPQSEIEYANPTYPVDLVAISGTSTFVNALNESLNKWCAK